MRYLTYSSKALIFSLAGIVFFSGTVYVLNSAIAARVDTRREIDIFEGIVRDNRVSETRYAPNEIIVKLEGEDVFQRVRVSPGIDVEDILVEYRNRDAVIYAEPNYIASAFFVPNDPYYGYQWNFNNSVNGGIHMDSAWDISQGEDVVVAVIDTGIAYEDTRLYRQAPDLSSTSFVQGYDFVGNDNHPNDDNGHGTHVAGTIAQSTNNGLGVSGIAFRASLMPIKVLGSNGSGTYADVAEGIRWAADNGAKVINLSLGGPTGASYLEEALKYAYEKGVVIIAASGNDNNIISYPAAYDDYVIAVGATRFDKTRAPYSNYGLSLDIVAPGGDVTVDQNGDGYGDGILQQTFGNNVRSFGYYFFQGTSMAAPHVAGAAALLISQGNLSNPDDVRMALQSTAEDLGVSGWDSLYGWGLVNVAAALQYSSTPLDMKPSIGIISPQAGSTIGGIISISASASDDNGVEYVSFYIDDSLLGVSSTSPYEINWNTFGVADGWYNIRAEAYDTAGQYSNEEISVEVNNINNPPIAEVGQDVVAEIGQIILFDGSSSYDTDGSIISYVWDFGDGSSLESGTSSMHAYPIPGSYTVTLTIEDNEGSSNSDTLIVEVQDPSQVPQAVISIDMSTRGLFRWEARAEVLIKDKNGDPVVGASVEGIWSGIHSGTYYGTTNSNGYYTFRTSRARAAGTATFTVTRVVKNGSEYELTGEVSDSIYGGFSF